MHIFISPIRAHRACNKSNCKLCSIFSSATQKAAALISTVKSTGSVVNTVTTPSFNTLLVLTFPPNVVSQSVTSHTKPFVVITLGPPTGIIPQAGPKTSFGKLIRFSPFANRNVIPSSESKKIFLC